jgi:hypothetical protein
MRVTLVDPQFLVLTNYRKNRRFKAGAPAPPVLRFSVLKEWLGGDGHLRSERIDGHLMIYDSLHDDARWQPPKIGSGFKLKTVIHLNKALASDVEAVLGYPSEWAGNEVPGTEAHRRVKEGYYQQFLDKARAWRRAWFLETPKAAKKEAKEVSLLKDEIGQYVDS